jgi:hypothetical protein
MHGSSILRRLTAWVMLGLYGLVASGLPLPLPLPPAAGSAAATKLAAKDRSRPFPCMDKPCGCATAEQCFTNCCCHTPAERLAWAKARGLEPAVLAALERRAVAAEPAPAAGSCCAAKVALPAKPAPSCCEIVAAATCCEATAHEPACCEQERPACCEIAAAGLAAEPRAEHPSEHAPPAGRVIVLKAMLACGGLADALAIAALGGSLPPPVVEFLPAEELRQVVVSGDDDACRLPSEPAEPPPRH